MGRWKLPDGTLTVAEAAARAGVSPSTINRAFPADRYPRPLRTGDIDLFRLRRRLNPPNLGGPVQGELSMAEAAQIIGVSKATISTWMREGKLSKPLKREEIILKRNEQRLLNQTEMAERLGLSRQQVSNLVKAGRLPRRASREQVEAFKQTPRPKGRRRKA